MVLFFFFFFLFSGPLGGKIGLAHKYFTSKMTLTIWVNLMYTGPPVLRVTFMLRDQSYVPQILILYTIRVSLV